MFMSRKVLMINGSFRKARTYNLLVQIVQILKNHDIESEIINLFDYDIKHCKGCDDICIKHDACIVKDDMSALMQKIMEADGLVLSSPVYINGVTSQFKAFADRTNQWFHKPAPAGKPVLLVTTTAATGVKETIHFLEHFSTGFGARKGGSITRTNKTINTPAGEKELARFISLLEKDRKNYSPGMNEIVIFNVQKVLALKSTGKDRQFWEEKNWIPLRYYYDCKMNPAKKAFSKMMFGILTGALK